MIAGRYSLDREIGRGGTGTVWLGHDQVLGREVALKRLGLVPGARSTDLARAEREARLTAQLHHPRVVTVFNVVVDPDTQAHWLVMEHVDGADLARLVREQGPLTPDAAAPLLWQAADALVAAHAVGIVHRDVKPSNILVDHAGRAKLTDFGIARIASDPALTQTGMVIGSPAYLAPEVAAGSRGDEAADVWSLGATLFFALSGRPPYDMGDNVLGGLYRIVNEEPPRLSDAGWLGPLLEGTMVRDPARRWSMGQVREFLADGPARSSGHGAARSSAAAATAAPEPGGRRSGRAPLVWLGVALAVALVVAVLATYLVRDPEPDTPAAQSPSAQSPSASTSTSPSAGPSSPSPGPARPTARGMRAFVRDYVATVAVDPDASWTMLTPRFQRQSGGRAAYRRFWDPVGRGRLLSLSADPGTLLVSYRVRFANFGTGRRTTVLKLVFEDGRYLIDGERSA